MSLEQLERSELIELHTNSQANANHYNQINWVLHGLSVALISTVGVEMVTNWDAGDFGRGEFLGIGIFGAFVFFVGYGWREIYLSHKKMIFTCYDICHRVEAVLSSRGQDFSLHSRIKLEYESEQKDPEKRTMKTSDVIGGVQDLFVNGGVALCVFGLVCGVLMR